MQLLDLNRVDPSVVVLFSFMIGIGLVLGTVLIAVLFAPQPVCPFPPGTVITIP